MSAHFCVVCNTFTAALINCHIQMVELIRTDVTGVHSHSIFCPFGHLRFGSNGTAPILLLIGSRDLRWRYVQQNYSFVYLAWTKLTVVICVKCAKIFLIT